MSPEKEVSTPLTPPCRNAPIPHILPTLMYGNYLVALIFTLLVFGPGCGKNSEHSEPLTAAETQSSGVSPVTAVVSEIPPRAEAIFISDLAAHELLLDVSSSDLDPPIPVMGQWLQSGTLFPTEDIAPGELHCAIKFRNPIPRRAVGAIAQIKVPVNFIEEQPNVASGFLELWVHSRRARTRIFCRREKSRGSITLPDLNAALGVFAKVNLRAEPTSQTPVPDYGDPEWDPELPYSDEQMAEIDEALVEFTNLRLPPFEFGTAAAIFKPYPQDFNYYWTAKEKANERYAILDDLIQLLQRKPKYMKEQVDRFKLAVLDERNRVPFYWNRFESDSILYDTHFSIGDLIENIESLEKSRLTGIPSLHWQVNPSVAYNSDSEISRSRIPHKLRRKELTLYPSAGNRFEKNPERNEFYLYPEFNLRRLEQKRETDGTMTIRIAIEIIRDTEWARREVSRFLERPDSVQRPRQLRRALLGQWKSLDVHRLQLSLFEGEPKATGLAGTVVLARAKPIVESDTYLEWELVTRADQPVERPSFLIEFEPLYYVRGKLAADLEPGRKTEYFSADDWLKKKQKGIKIGEYKE